jgi:hypothetical protein
MPPSIESLAPEILNSLKAILLKIESNHKTYEGELLALNSSLEAKIDNLQSLFESLESECRQLK